MIWKSKLKSQGNSKLPRDMITITP